MVPPQSIDGESKSQRVYVHATNGLVPKQLQRSLRKIRQLFYLKNLNKYYTIEFLNGQET